MPSSPPPVVGPPLIPNDPCTTLSAIVTRPTVTNSVCTVRPGHVLLETGFQSTAYAGSGTVAQAPQALLRLGTDLPGLEFDLQLPSYQHASLDGAGYSGITDGGLGLKYVLGASPKMSYGLQTAFTVPVGTSGFSAGGTVQNYAFNATLALGPIFALGTTQNVALASAGGRAFASYQPTLVLSAAVPSTTLSLFIEGAQFGNADGPSTATRTQLLGGLSLDPTSRFQVDLEYGYSPTVSTGKYRYVGVGLSYYR
jgi:hypothetical protein